MDIDLIFRKVDESADGSGTWWSWGGGTVVSRANCTIITEQGELVATFSTTYDLSFSHDFWYFVQIDIEKNAPIWWASRMLTTYYFSTLMALASMPSLSNPSNTRWTAVDIRFSTNQTTNVRSGDLFSLDYYALASSGTILNYVQQPVSTMFNNKTVKPSMALTEARNFARILYSAILVDLGQNVTSNLLLDNSMLQWALAHPDDTFRNDPKNVLNCSTESCFHDYDRWNTIAAPDNIDNAVTRQVDPPPRYQRINLWEAYQKLTPPTSGPGTLVTQSATMFSQYSCSVPIRRDIGATILAVLVAVFVYLRAAWALLNLIAKPLVVRKDPLGADACSGGAAVSVHASHVDGDAKFTNTSPHSHPYTDGNNQLQSHRSLKEYNGHIGEENNYLMKSFLSNSTNQNKYPNGPTVGVTETSAIDRGNEHRAYGNDGHYTRVTENPPRSNASPLSTTSFTTQNQSTSYSGPTYRGQGYERLRET